MGVGEVSASKVCGGAHGSLPPPPTFKNVPTPMKRSKCHPISILISDLESSHQGAFLHLKMKGGLQLYFLTPHCNLKTLVARGRVGTKNLDKGNMQYVSTDTGHNKIIGARRNVINDIPYYIPTLWLYLRRGITKAKGAELQKHNKILSDVSFWLRTDCMRLDPQRPHRSVIHLPFSKQHAPTARPKSN